MAELSDAVSVDLFAPPFADVRRVIDANTVPEFRANCGEKIAGVCMFVWDEMVHRGRVRNPQKIARIVQNDFVGIYSFVQRNLGKAPLTQAHASRFFNEFDQKRSFADVFLARCYPNDIHICDVEFSDNRRRVAADDPTEPFRAYHGLHVFDVFLERLRGIAQQLSAERISLIVAYPPLHAVFSRHGFAVSETTMAQRAFRMAGHGHPMVLNI